MSKKEPPVAHSMAVWASSEFQAFARRFGIPLDLQTRAITIRIPLDGPMDVTQEYIATDSEDDGIWQAPTSTT